jgi:transcriptional regulator with XRE-family HTH domain
VTIGRIIRRLRMRRGWYLRELEAATGIANADLSRYEQGRHAPSIGNAIRLADAFGVTLDELCGRAPLPRVPRPPSLRTMAEARETAGGTR